MKKIKELSKGELEHALRNEVKDIDYTEPQFECACCGKTDKARFYYICDKCNDRLTQDSMDAQIL